MKLIVTDHLPWNDAHLRLLQEKINSYIAFVESGQLTRMKEPPIPLSPDVLVSLAAQYQPNEEAKVFLKYLEEFLKRSGIGFELKVHSEG